MSGVDSPTVQLDTLLPVNRSNFWHGAKWLILALSVAMPLLYKPTLHGIDGVRYCVWIRSVVFDGDLNVDNEYCNLQLSKEYGYYEIMLPTGYRYHQRQLRHHHCSLRSTSWLTV